MARKIVEQRVDRFEPVLQLLAEGRLSLKKQIEELARDTGKSFDRLAKRSAESARRARATDKRTDKLLIAKRKTDKKYDERVDQLVTAIRECIRRQNGRS